MLLLLFLFLLLLLLRRNVIVLKDVQLILYIVCLVPQQLQLLLIRLEHIQLRLERLQLLIHVGGGGVHSAAQTRKGAGQLPAEEVKIKHTQK